MYPTPQGGRLRRCARRRGGRLGPPLLPCLSTSNFRATSEQLKGRVETAGQGTPACPRAAAAFASSPPARRRHLGRNLPGAYRNLLCGVTAFRLNPASSSRPSSRPLRRSRMLARCAAPPPGSWGPWEDAAPSPDAAALGPVVPAYGEAGKHVWWGKLALAPRPGAAHTLGDTRAQPLVALRKLSACPGNSVLPPRRGSKCKR